MKRVIGRIGLTSFALAGFLVAGQRAGAGRDYEELAKSFLSEHDQEAWIQDGPTGHRFDELLDSAAFVRIEVGSLDLRIPRLGLKDADVAEEFKATVSAVVDMQQRWLEWSAPPRAAERGDDWKTLSKWVKSWTKGKLGKADGGQSLYDALSASDAVRQAAGRLAEATRFDEATRKALGELGRMVFAPGRRDFIQTLALAGWWDEALRPNLWSEAVLDRTLEWVGWTQIVCMRYTTLPVDPERPFVGVNMSADDKTGLAQYMTERASALLLRRKFWRQDAHFFEQALATNLVIAGTGKNNLHAGEWKLETRTSGSTSQPYSRFVPGGNPAGGTLPKNPAGPGTTSGSATEISLYRTSEGTDYFLEPLRKGQVAGAKLVAKDKKRRLADDRNVHFALHSFSSRGDLAVTAPFLGQEGEKQNLPPNEFLDDYEDFFRAYRAGFLYWLQRHALPNEAESQAKFAELIATHANRPTRALSDVAMQEVYGQPISAVDGSSESLEWRFLAWLSKRR